MTTCRLSALAVALGATFGLAALPAAAQRVDEAKANVQADLATERAQEAAKDAREASAQAKRAARAAAMSGDAASAHAAHQASVAAEHAKNEAVESAHQATGLASGVGAGASVAPRDTALSSSVAASASEQASRRAEAQRDAAVDASLPPPPPAVPASANASANATVATSAPGAMAAERHMTGAGRFHIDTGVLDTNRDGFLSREEASANITLNNQFTTIDANADGRIGTDELRSWISSGGLARNSLPVDDALSGVGSANAFQMLDLDGDGVLTSKEAGVERTLGARFRSLDIDRDGRLSRTEFDAWNRSPANKH